MKEPIPQMMYRSLPQIDICPTNTVDTGQDPCEYRPYIRSQALTQAGYRPQPLDEYKKTDTVCTGHSSKLGIGPTRQVCKSPSLGSFGLFAGDNSLNRFATASLAEEI
jgi:hypothetical protein